MYPFEGHRVPVHHNGPNPLWPFVFVDNQASPRDNACQNRCVSIERAPSASAV